MTEFLERMGSAVCHQMAERSFIWGEGRMPLCARCTGIYLGVVLAFCLLFFKKRMQAGKPFSRAEALLTAIAVLPVGVDGVSSYLGFWKSSQLMRVLTGSLVGTIVPGFLLLAVNFDPKGGKLAAIYEKAWELPLMMAVSVGLGLCLWAGLPLQGIVAVVSIAGEVLLWGGFIWLIFKNLLGNRKLPYWRISLLVAFVSLFTIGGLVP